MFTIIIKIYREISWAFYTIFIFGFIGWLAYVGATSSTPRISTKDIFFIWFGLLLLIAVRFIYKSILFSYEAIKVEAKIAENLYFSKPGSAEPEKTIINNVSDIPTFIRKKQD